MLCKKPYFKDGKAFGCGQCLFCRINKRREWTHRLMLETAFHGETCFVTLTYAPVFLMDRGSLVPDHMTKFVRALRKLLLTSKLRYFGCGEYGSETQRPHYHLILYGIGLSGVNLIKKAWKYGFVHVGDVTWQSTGYVCGYVTKGMTKKGAPALQDRHPEFARMSLKPGIGASAIPQVAKAYTGVHGARAVSRDGDVPPILIHGRKRLPLGRYLTRRLRSECGFEEIGAQDNAAVRAMRAAKQEIESFDAGTIEQKRMNIEARYRIFAKKDRL